MELMGEPSLYDMVRIRGTKYMELMKSYREKHAPYAEGHRKYIAGLMMESFIEGGSQPAGPLDTLIYGRSITDRCISWPDTEALLRELAQAVKTRRG